MLKIVLILFMLASNLSATVLKVGLTGNVDYTSVSQASEFAVEGDTIYVLAGIYPGGQYITELKGTSDNWIYIIGESTADVVFSGSTEAWHLTDVEYLHISGFTFENQTGNGVNIDDGGSYDTPSRKVIIENCIWRQMAVSGNNDELKLSGLDDFIVRHCTFLDGSAGGSLVDMVGCHFGLFENNHFQNGGSNCIQAKGGTKNIRIERNTFINGGMRTINIGGSTGLPYFRPKGINYESSDITVFANVFFGSQAPIAFVGTINSKVYNNTIIQPGKWAIRILQESVEGFLPCGNNYFVNNIVYLGNNAANPTLNIGQNTSPETFTFSNNLWYNYDNQNWSGPNLPVSESNGIIGENPQLIGLDTKEVKLEQTSPAIGKGLSLIGIREISLPKLDYYGNIYWDPPSIGAVERNLQTSIPQSEPGRLIKNIKKDMITVSVPRTDEYIINFYNITGERICPSLIKFLAEGINNIRLSSLLKYTSHISANIIFIVLKSPQYSEVQILNYMSDEE